MDEPRPTATELDVLRILWERGPSTVREVHEAISAERAMGYTGALKLLQIMAGKGLVVRDEGERAHVYAAARSAQDTKRQVAGELMRKVFGGSASDLVLHALQDRKASSADIAEIRRMLDAYEAAPGRTDREDDR
jgi:predicted transcriptional regulator